jgi:hypothetical protein
MGLSLRWQGHRWPGDADPDFCTPEVSYAVAREVAIKAINVYHAQDVLDIQAVYSGRVGHYVQPNGRRYNFADPNEKTASITCPGMKRRGVRCRHKVSRGDLGPSIPKAERIAFVEELIARRPPAASGA